MADETKLPKWAQDTLSHLRAEIAGLEAVIVTLKGEPSRGATGKVCVDEFPHIIPLHDRAAVRFTLPNGSVTCMLRENGEILDLNCNGTMQIFPRAANSAFIKADR